MNFVAPGAVVFDCDGVLVDTERDAHRVGFNKAFAAFGIDAEWSVALYGRLLLTAGGKERMRRLMEMIAQERVDLTPLLTHHFALDDIEHAFDVFSHQRDGVLKVVLHPAVAPDHLLEEPVGAGVTV